MSRGGDHDATATNYPAIVAAWSAEERRERELKLRRKIDFRLVPILMLMFIMNSLDRNNLPQAKVQGLATDLNLVGVQYNIVLSLTFVGYISMQIPSNIILSVSRPSIYLPAFMAVWGVISACTGAVNNFPQILACRFLLGVAESPFVPGVVYLFSGWYTRKELGFRLALFFSGNMLAGAFSGLFAAGLTAAFHGNTIAPWRWLFIIEGAATVVFAIACSFIIPDWPTTTKWLSEEEKALAVMRMIEDAGGEEEDIGFGTAMKMAVKDYRVWVCVANQSGLQVIASMSNFLPTLVANFGFSTVQTLLMTSPPYLLTAAFSLFNTWYSDRTGRRARHIIIPSFFVLGGIIIMLATTNVPAQYFALFVLLPGSYGCFQISNAWMANIAARPNKKRAIALAMNNAFGNISIVWTSYLYPSTDSPRFTTAWCVNLAVTVLVIISAAFLTWRMKKENQQREQLEAENPDIIDEKNGTTHQFKEYNA